jgi:type IV secretion system protein VirB1
LGAAAVALATLLQQCAPNVGERTMTAIVRVESNASPLAIYDNTSGRSFSPRTVREAMYTASTLVDAGHSVDLGLAQVNSANLSRLGMSIRDAFDPCSNLHGAATILQTAYDAASSRFSPGPYALRRAIGAYNSGSIFGGDTYVDRILAAAGLPPEASRRMPDLETTAYLPGPAVGLPSPVSAPVAMSAQLPVAHVQPVKPKHPAGPNPFAAPILVMSAQPTVQETLLQPSDQTVHPASAPLSASPTAPNSSASAQK